MLFFMRALVLGLVLLVSWPTWAASTAADAPRTPAPKLYLDYRPQLFASDAAALSVFVAAAMWSEGPQTELALTGLGIYVLGAPTVHLAHAQPLRALTSVGMRVGFPTAGALLGLGLANGCRKPEDDSGFGCLAVAVGLAAIGVIGGSLTAIIIDDGFLGRVPIEETRKTTHAQKNGLTLSLAPLLNPKQKTLGVSMIGAF